MAERPRAGSTWRQVLSQCQTGRRASISLSVMAYSETTWIKRISGQKDLKKATFSKLGNPSKLQQFSSSLFGSFPRGATNPNTWELTRLSKASRRSLEDVMHIPIFSIAISANRPHSASSLFLTCSVLLIACPPCPLQPSRAISMHRHGRPKGSASPSGAVPQLTQDTSCTYLHNRQTLAKGKGKRGAAETAQRGDKHPQQAETCEYPAVTGKSGAAVFHAQGRTHAQEHLRGPLLTQGWKFVLR